MRVMGHNVFAIIVAALLIYAIEFVIFAHADLARAVHGVHRRYC